MATQLGNADAIQALAEGGADLNAATNGATQLCLLRLRRHADVIRALAEGALVKCFVQLRIIQDNSRKYIL
jgi:hypothetical protein